MWKFFDKYGGQRASGSSEIQLDFAQITADTGSLAATTEGTAVAVVTGASILCDGSQLKLEFGCPALTSVSGAAVTVFGVFYMDNTPIGQFIMTAGDTQNTLWRYPIMANRYYTPPAGAHVFSVRLFTSVASNVVVGAGNGSSGAKIPTYLRVVRAA